MKRHVCAVGLIGLAAGLLLGSGCKDSKFLDVAIGDENGDAETETTITDTDTNSHNTAPAGEAVQ